MKNEMTPRERFCSALQGKEPDRVPIFDAPNNPELFKNELGQDNRYSLGMPMVNLSRKLGLDACLVAERGYTGLIAPQWKWEGNSKFIDELGVGFICNNSSWPLGIPTEPVIKTRESWERITLPNPRESWRHDEIRKAVAEAHQGKADDIAVVAGVRSAFSVMYISMGIEHMSMGMYDDPKLITEIAEEITAFWTESSIAAIEAGADAVFIANDLGLNSGTIISPDAIRTHFLPSFEKQVKRIHQAGGKVILHSCGNINDILGDLVETEIDCYNNIQVGAGMSLEKVKKEYGGRLALMGNVDATNIMTKTESGVIEEAVLQAIRTAAPGGGYILASDHSFHKGIPIENVYRFIEAGKKYGVYPVS